MEEEQKKVKGEITEKKESILLILFIALVIGIIWFCIKEPQVIISRGGITNDYYKYGEYASLIKFVDNYSSIEQILCIVSLILGIISLVMAIIKIKLVKGTSSAKGKFIVRRMCTAIFIVLIPVIIPFMILSFNGVKVVHCWCGLDYVKVEYKK